MRSSDARHAHAYVNANASSSGHCNNSAIKLASHHAEQDTIPEIQSGCNKIFTLDTDETLADQRTGKVACPGCGQQVGRFNDLRNHLKKWCTGQEHQYKCKSCSYETLSRDCSRKQSGTGHKHKLKLKYIYLPKYFGCACCGAYLKHFKDLQQHVSSSAGHTELAAFIPDGFGHVLRLRGLLQQPRMSRELEKYCTSQDFAQWLETLDWEHDFARSAAERLMYRFIDASEGLESRGMPPEDIPGTVQTILNNCTQPRAGPSDQQSSILASSRGKSTQGHKRVVSTDSTELPESLLRARESPEIPKEWHIVPHQIDEDEYSSGDLSSLIRDNTPYTPASTQQLPLHLEVEDHNDGAWLWPPLDATSFDAQDLYNNQAFL